MAILNYTDFSDYASYRQFIDDCVAKNITSGNEQTNEKIEATKLNIVRIRRIEKQFELSNEIKALLDKLHKKITWIVLTEIWCGDSAQNLPIIAKAAAYSTNINLQLILRDKHPEIMDKYLTNGSRAIPKLICLDAQTNSDLAVWGPRPAKIQNIVKAYKSENPNVSHDEFVKNLHLWYAKDKGESMQEDLVVLLKTLI
jgi:hypothetical protein